MHIRSMTGFTRYASVRRLALALLLVMAGAWPAAHAQSEDPGTYVVAVEPDPGEPRGLADILADVLDGAPLSIRRQGTPTTLETDGIGYQRLLASPSLATVRLLSTSLAQANDARAAPGETRSDLVSLRIEIRTRPVSGPPRQGISAAESRDATHSARIVQRRRYSDWLPPSPPPGPGMLVVTGRNGQGDVIWQRVVKDPRLVRFEASGPGGRLTRRRDFIRTRAELTVAVPRDPRVVTVSIADPPGSGGARELARMPMP